MKEMIRKYRGTLISSALVILAGVLVGFTSIQGKWINLFFVVMQCVFVAIIFYDNRNRQQNRKVIGMTIWIIPVITLLYNGIVRLVDMGADIENLFMAFIYYGTGLMFMVIGNYLPKVKQNNTIGIRVVWTLQDEENWSATHRFSGKIWVVSGILCMLCGLFAESIAALVLYVVSIMAAVIISVLYSYLFYKKKIETGEKLKIQYKKKAIVGYGIVTILTIIFIIGSLFWGSIDIQFQDNSFTIKAQGWSDYTVDYTKIDSISYEESIAALVLYVVSIMAAVIISVLYSYLFYKKKIETGEKLKIQYKKKAIVGYGIVTILTIIFIIGSLFWGSIDIQFQDNSFTIKAQGWSDYTVDYTKIDSISYEENLFQNSNDYRINGLGNFKYAMGNFRNDVYGNYIRYTHSSCHSYVVMSIGGKILVVNGENDPATKEIYHNISEKK